MVYSVKVNGATATVSSYDKTTGIVTLTSAPDAGTDNVIVNYPDTANAALYAYVYDGDSAGKLKANATAVVTEQTIAFIIPIGEASSVTAILSDSVIYVTKAEFDAHLSATNPHRITAATINLEKVPNVSTNDQTPTYSTPENLSNLTSGEKISLALGKLNRLVINFIAHLSANNPHGITANGINAAASEHTHSVSDISSGTLGVARGGTGASNYTAFKSASGITADINNAVMLCKTMAGAIDLTTEQSYNASVPWVYVALPDYTNRGWIKIRALRSSSTDYCIGGDIFCFYDYITGTSTTFSAGDTIWLYLTHRASDNTHNAYVMKSSITPAQYVAAYAERGF